MDPSPDVCVCHLHFYQGFIVWQSSYWPYQVNDIIISSGTMWDKIPVKFLQELAVLLWKQGWIMNHVKQAIALRPQKSQILSISIDCR